MSSGIPKSKYPIEKIRELAEAGYTLDKIRKELHVRKQYLNQVMRENNISNQNQRRRGKLLEALRKHADGTRTRREVADILGISYDALVSILNYHSITVPFSRRTWTGNHERSDTYKQLRASGMSVKQIAGQFGVTLQAVYIGIRSAEKRLIQPK